jgi:hypothetical protein
MASNLLLVGPDEVARNGAFWKSLRPEVFPDAPLQFPVVEHSAAFSEIPPKAVPRISLKENAAQSAPSHLDRRPVVPVWPAPRKTVVFGAHPARAA